MAITATFLSGIGLLSVFGDGLGNTVTFSRNAAGTILINGGAVPVLGGTPTVANTSRIQAFGLNDDDVITLDEAFGASVVVVRKCRHRTQVLFRGIAASDRLQHGREACLDQPRFLLGELAQHVGDAHRQLEAPSRSSAAARS